MNPRDRVIRDEDVIQPHSTLCLWYCGTFAVRTGGHAALRLWTTLATALSSRLRYIQAATSTTHQFVDCTPSLIVTT